MDALNLDPANQREMFPPVKTTKLIDARLLTFSVEIGRRNILTRKITRRRYRLSRFSGRAQLHRRPEWDDHRLCRVRDLQDAIEQQPIPF